MTNRIVVITGASAGVGRAAARLFAAQGDDVALIARGSDGLEATRAEIEKLGCRALVLPIDVANADDLEKAAQAVEDELGPIDVWVNNAMASVFAPFTEISADDFKRVTEVTYHSYVHGTRAALRHMLPRDHGTIIQVGSALAYRGIPLQSAYCGAKHAVQGFNESLRCELFANHSKVSVTMIQLPALNTPQFGWVKTTLPKRPQPVPPIFQPEIAAEAILWASTRRKREVYVGLPSVLTIVGNKFIPGLLDRYLGKTGFASQQSDQPIGPDRQDNLWSPVPGDHGAHGDFDARAFGWSPQWWASKNRSRIIVGAGLFGALAWMRRD